MNELFILVGLAVGLLCGIITLFIVLRRRAQASKVDLSELERLEREIHDEIKQAGIDELRQTQAGKELLLEFPLPDFDPRVLEELDEPGGALKLDDRFYIERDADERLRQNIVRTGTTITVRGSRQTGKSSLLARGIHHARSNQASVVYIDMQRIESNEFGSLDRLLIYLAHTIARKFGIETNIVDQIWENSFSSQDNLSKLLEEYIFPKGDNQIVLAMDEVDRLLGVHYRNDFFGMLRSWHNYRAIDSRWNKLNILMAIATEPYLLISDPIQSPFNVGTTLELDDFNRDQVRDLNNRHGSPIGEKDFDAFFELFNGHPYLTRKALYLIVGEAWTWDDLYYRATDDQGPFVDHLQRQLWIINEDSFVQNALRQIIRENKCDDDIAMGRLSHAGLVKGGKDHCYFRCKLYEKYFSEHVTR